jgi:hypothetical protein
VSNYGPLKQSDLVVELRSELQRALEANEALKRKNDFLVATEVQNQRLTKALDGVHEALQAILWAADLENVTLMRQALPKVREAAAAVVEFLDDIE